MLLSRNILTLSFIIISAFFLSVNGQDTTEVVDQLIVKNSDNFIAERIDDVEIQTFRGNVKLVQDSTFMFCDSAQIIENMLTAVGEVVIIQDDSIQVFSDSLYYNGDEKIAELFYGVVLQNLDKELFTGTLRYDLNTKIASFQDTATLRKATMTLSSIEGIYNMNTKLAYFYKEVSIVDGDFKLLADSLGYDIEADRAFFLGPTYIIEENRKIYCTEGYYDINIGEALFEGNPKIVEDSRTTEALSIYYSLEDSLTILSGNAIVTDTSGVSKGDRITINDKTQDIIITGDGYFSNESQTIQGPYIKFNRETEDLYLDGRSKVDDESGVIEADTLNYLKSKGTGYAFGNVIWVDTIDDRTLYSDAVFINDSLESYIAKSIDQRPMLTRIVDGDTLYTSADVLKKKVQDSIEILEAGGRVLIFKEDFQARCDSLYYTDVDSTFTLMTDPVCWSDTTQYSGDTIKIVLQSGSIKAVNALSNALITTKISENYYNQVKANDIYSFMDSTAIERMDAIGNAESIYMVLDEDNAFVGANKIICAEMKFHFKNDSLDNISFLQQSDSQMTPMDKAKDEDLYLPGMKWRPSIRPMDSKEIRIIKHENVSRPQAEPEDEFSAVVSDIIGQNQSSDNRENFVKRYNTSNLKGKADKTNSQGIPISKNSLKIDSSLIVIKNGSFELTNEIGEAPIEWKPLGSEDQLRVQKHKERSENKLNSLDLGNHFIELSAYENGFTPSISQQLTIQLTPENKYQMGFYLASGPNNAKESEEPITSNEKFSLRLEGRMGSEEYTLLQEVTVNKLSDWEYRTIDFTPKDYISEIRFILASQGDNKLGKRSVLIDEISDIRIAN